MTGVQTCALPIYGVEDEGDAEGVEVVIDAVGEGLDLWRGCCFERCVCRELGKVHDKALAGRSEAEKDVQVDTAGRSCWYR